MPKEPSDNYNMFIPFPLFYFVTPYVSFKQSFLYSLAVSVVVYSVEPDGLPDWDVPVTTLPLALTAKSVIVPL